MSYGEAFKIGWSILWRQSAWAVFLAVAVWAIYKDQHAVGIGAIPVAAVALIFYFLPLTIRRLTAIRYSDFHLSVSRPEGEASDFTYVEALALSFSIHLVNAFLAVPLMWLLRETYQYVLLMFYPLFVAGPLAAFVLANFPTQRFELQVIPNSWLPEIHSI
jgi:hypothetical protein